MTPITKKSIFAIEQIGATDPIIVHFIWDELGLQNMTAVREGIGHSTLDPSGSPSGNDQTPPGDTIISYHFPPSHAYRRELTFHNGTPHGGIAIEHRYLGRLMDSMPYVTITIAVTQS